MLSKSSRQGSKSRRRGWLLFDELVIAILVGVSMLFSGISRLMLSLAARHLTAL
jgi:hypothetical protein